MFFLIVLLTVVWLYFLWTRRHLYILAWKLPGPLAWPILGNILSMWNEEENILYMDEIARKYSSPSRIWMGPNLYVFIHDAVSVETVLRARNCLDKPSVYEVVRDALGADGLFTLKGEDWRLHRKLMSPSLKDSTVFSHLTIFNHYIREFCNVQMVNEVNNAKAFDILLPLNVCLVSMYLDATFGIEWTHKSDYSLCFSEAVMEVVKQIFRPWLQIRWLRKLTNYDKKVNYFRKFSDTILDGIIKRSIENGSTNDTFIDKFIRISQENSKFSIKDIKVEAHTILIGASDTTGVGLSTTLLMLAMHEEKQQKVYEELLSVMTTKDMDLTAAHLNKLTYLDQCIRESLRLFPTVPLIGRSPSEPIVLNNVEIPAGLPVIIGIRQIQRHAEYWGEDAHIFKPERFASDADQTFKSFPAAYIPFSLGPRNCLGYSYAMYTMKLVLAHIICNYRLTTPLKMNELKIRLSISFRLVNKHLIQVHRRED